MTRAQEMKQAAKETKARRKQREIEYVEYMKEKAAQGSEYAKMWLERETAA
jgi:hypothetical protein